MSKASVELLMAFRAGRAGVLSLLVGIVAPRFTKAQQPADDVLSSSTMLMQPLTPGTPADLTQRLVFDPSPHGLAPWVAFGLRWAWAAAPDRNAYPIGTVGLRFRRQALRMALGVSRDAVYGRAGRRDKSSSRPPSLPSPPVMLSSDSVICPSGLVLDPSKGCVPSPQAGGAAEASQPGYVMEPATDITGAAEWSAGRLALGVQSGWRMAGPASRRLWYSATVATPIAPMFALVASVDRWHDAVFWSSAARMTLGLRWQWDLRRRSAPPDLSSAANHDRKPAPAQSPSRGNLAVYRLPNGIRLSFATPSRAIQVEVRSDLTGWTTVPMMLGVDGRWQLDLAASPGVHRLTIRVDGGAWLPPPGLPAGSDGYGGAVGLFAVEP